MWNRHLYPSVVWAFGIPWNCCRKQMHLIFKSSATMWVTPTQKAPTVRAHALSQFCSFLSLSTESDSLCCAHSAHALSEFCSLTLSLSLWAQLFGGAVLLSFWQPLLRSIIFVSSVGFVASAPAVLCLPECLCASVSVCVHGAWLATKGQRVKARRCLIKKCKQSVCCLLICPRILCVY